MVYASVLQASSIPSASSKIVFKKWTLQEDNNRPYIETPLYDTKYKGVMTVALYEGITTPVVSLFFDPFFEDAVVSLCRHTTSTPYAFKAHDNRLWSEDEKADNTFIQAMKQGRQIDISAKEKIGSFSLMGFTEALNALMAYQKTSSKS